jgi:DMSO/TMAO reductase YedYZ molybdopterin-dependent catalytic subunit
MPLLPGLSSYRKAPRNPHGLFALEGEVERPQSFSYLDLAEIHRYYQVADLSLVDERLAGKGVRLRRLLDLAGPVYGTHYLTVESLDGGFSACLSIAEVGRTALIVYERDGKPLTPEQGGPARFVVPYYPDACANVKSIGRIVVSRERGRDTRPSQKAVQG